MRSEQNKYEAFSRQRNTVMTKYRRINQSFNDLVAGLMRAQNFYSEMKETVTSLQKNVETFVNNRRSEGGQLLAKIEQGKSQGADQEQQRLKELMERMSMDPSGSPVSAGSGGRKKSIPPPLSSTPGYPSTSTGGIPAYNPAASPPVTPRYPMPSSQQQQQQQQQQSQPYMSPQQSYGAPPRRESYNHNPYPQHAHSSSQSYNPAQHYNPTSPPAHQQFFSPPPPQQQSQQPPPQQQWGQQPGWAGAQQGLPQGYVPPPPPPGPPPAQHAQQGQEYAYGGYGGRMQGSQQQQYQNQQQPQHQHQHQQHQQQQNDPWAGLSGWK